MYIDWFTILATIINFIILFLIVKHFLFKPVNGALESRQNEIEARIRKSEEDQKKAEALRIENEIKLKNAAEEGRSIIENYKSKAEKISKEIVDQANSEAQLILDRGKNELQREVEKATESIRTQAADLAFMVSSQALGKALDESQHRKLIEEFISKVGI